MKGLKHSKVKNTGILFELLVRQITAEAFDGVDGHGLPILKKYFGVKSELGKEYQLYKILVNEKYDSENRGNILLSSVLDARKKINNKKLSDQKYNLISEIKKNYDIEEFFKTPLPNYKELASIYKLFEYTEIDNPIDYARTKITLIESITHKPVSQKEADDITYDLDKEPKDIRNLAYKLMVEKFNEKYGSLSERHKSLLKEYINATTNATGISDYLRTEATRVEKDLDKKLKLIKDTRMKIRLTEAKNLLSEFSKLKTVEDNHIAGMMKYYDLLDELN